MRVLVVGAGPGGSAAAIELARGGAEVRLVEKARWPRPKTCGDGISPPGVKEASALGLDLGDRLPLEFGDLRSPGGYALRSGWRPDTPWGTIVERQDFDARLVDLALAAGARFDDATAVGELDPAAGAGNRKPGARFGTAPFERFDAIVLADGATGSLAVKSGFGRHRSRLVALRGYARAARPLDPAFGLFFDGGLAPGYAWIFPLDEWSANVGVLLDERAVRRQGGDLRGVLAAWLRGSGVARDALGPDPVLERTSGGVIPTGRSRRVRGGIFLVGDAAGVADPFSAEGISQALGSGRAAARALLRHGPGPQAERAHRAGLRPYDRNAAEARRLRLGFRFVMDPMVRRAQQRPALAQHLSANGLFMKESLPAFLWGIVRNW
jgi:geranylgeranyl reductase family protein